MTSALMDTYNRLPVSFTHGDGSYLFDAAGKRYLDAIGGIAVNGLGHNHPAVVKAISEQASRFIHCSNIYQIEQQQQLAERLVEITGMDNCFIGNSGAEANEAAIKLARLYGHQHGIDNPATIVMEGSFHGRTMATLSATGNRKIQAGFEPLVSGFVRAPYNNIEALQSIAANNSDVVAILVEPIQGEGGINVPADGYLQQLRALCDQHQWLLMLDEIQTGNGRTGHWYACQGESVTPDVMTTAKALANGVPIGVCMASGRASEVFSQGTHGSTYGGNPLACAAALAVLNTLDQDHLLDNARQRGQQLLDAFNTALAPLDGVTEVRGRGLMLGIELHQPCGELVTRALEQGLLINVAAGNTIRLLPPMNLTAAEADEIAEGVITLVTQWLQETASHE